ncbi:hypothetical protein [Paraburkholderia hayleyella]|uniref:hypothetical protein n=1 Tax=Paraburkholderia hayleyella TaxID=2152889 RepID=UPI001291DB5C|nr:hypothetical protein [Paraburkholderia hayleyella]
MASQTLLFEGNERGLDERLKLWFEAVSVSKLDSREREAIETVIASVLHMHDVKRWTQRVLLTPEFEPDVKRRGR